MSLNVEKNRQSIISAYSDVLNDKTATDWALFGYDGQTNDLKVVETGDGGLDELCNEFNSGKIMYSFVKIADPKTQLNKFVLINWQGEGAPVLRKGTCANHIRDVEKLLNGAHLTINARVEDDVEKDRIFAKVSAIGSAYSFKDHKFTEEVQKTPIGTAYSRVNPAKEINAKERDTFWRKEEEEEKKRVILEKERKKTELIKTEEERRTREEKEHTERERELATKTSSTNNNNNNNNITARSPVMPLSPTIHQQESPRGPTQAELMRQQRNQEAKELIGSRVGTAKAIFSQNSASGQMQTTKAAPAKPVRNSISQRINSLTNQQQPELKKPSFIIENDDVPEEKIIAEKLIDEKDESEIIVVKENITNVNDNTDEWNETNDNKEIIVTNGKTNEKLQEIIPEEIQQQQQQAPSPQPEYEDDDEDQYSTIKRSPHNKTSSQVPDFIEEKTVENRQTTSSSTTKTTIVQSSSPTKQTSPKSINTKTDEDNQNDLMSDESILFSDMNGGQRAKALYDYQAADESEITFDPNDIITHIDQIDEGWWQGLGPDGTYGLFPANYVELIKD